MQERKTQKQERKEINPIMKENGHRRRKDKREMQERKTQKQERKERNKNQTKERQARKKGK